MPRGRTRERFTLIGLTAAGAVLMTSSLAGAHGGDTSAVHACVEPASGSIRIVGAGDSCKKNENSLDWTKAGTIYTAGSGLALSAGNEFSVTGAPWSGLTGVPDGFADNDDNDGSVLVGELRSELEGFRDELGTDDEVANEESDPVSFTQINDLVESIFGLYIVDGSITEADIDTDSVGSDELADGAVTSQEISNGTIVAGDLALGAVTTDRVVSNASRGTTGAVSLTNGIQSSATETIMTIPTTEPNHNVLLTGQAVATCTCSGTDVVTVSYAIARGDGTLASPLMTVTLNSHDPNTVLPVSFLDQVSGGLHEYDLVFTATASGAGSSASVNSAVLNAIDLGRMTS